MADPEQPGMMRFWNGEQWTEHRTPMQQAQPQPSNPQLAPKPGWYPDPQRPGWSRFWNGTAWENDYRQSSVAPDAPSPRWSLTKVFLVWWGIVTGALAGWSLIDVLEAPALVAADLVVVNLFASALIGAGASALVTGLWALTSPRNRASRG